MSRAASGGSSRPLLIRFRRQAGHPRTRALAASGPADGPGPEALGNRFRSSARSGSPAQMTMPLSQRQGRGPSAGRPEPSSAGPSQAASLKPGEFTGPDGNERTTNGRQQLRSEYPGAVQMTESGGRMVFSADELTEALSVLDAAMAWHLLPARWAEVDRSLVALASALADGNERAFHSEILTLELLGPVRQATRSATSPVPGEVRARLLAAISTIEQLKTFSRVFLVSIYLADGSIHAQVELAVDELLRRAGLHIMEREEPVSGSWYRRMRATLDAAARGDKGQEALASAVHAADARFFLRQDAELTTLLLQNLGPVITALQPTKDAVVRAGALLIVKVDWVVAVHQLTPRQQLTLDHAPDLESAPHQVLKALGIAGTESSSPIHDPATGPARGDPLPE
jgi:hypothetical protein